MILMATPSVCQNNMATPNPLAPLEEAAELLDDFISTFSRQPKAVPDDTFFQSQILHDSLGPLYARIDELPHAAATPGQIPSMLTLAKELHKIWTAFPQTLSVANLSIFALAMFRFNLQDAPNLNKIMHYFHAHIKPIIVLQQCLCYAMTLTTPSSPVDVEALRDSVDQLTLVKHVIARFKAHVESLVACHSVVAATSFMEVNPTDCTAGASFPDMSEDCKHPLHALVDYILARLRAHQYVLSGACDKQWCCEQRYIKAKVTHTEDNLTRTVCRRVPTRYWHPVHSLKEFITRECDKETNFEHWKTLTSTRDMMKRLIPLFSTELRLTPNRHWFAFANGIYDSHNQLFFPYDEVHLMPHQPGLSRACINLFDKTDFVDINDAVDDLQVLLDIPTPVLDSIFKAQNFEPAVLQWVYAFFGRMFFPLHQWDRWPVIPLFMGEAGTGKTTIGQLLMEIFHADNVANMNANSGRDLVHESMLDRLLWIWSDDFSLSRTKGTLDELRLMISGETVLVHRLFKSDLLVKWKLPGMILGNNELPPSWPTSFMAKHVVTFSFTQAIDDPNPNLFGELKAELGSIIPKVTKVYRWLAREHGQRDIWSVLPSHLK